MMEGKVAYTFWFCLLGFSVLVVQYSLAIDHSKPNSDVKPWHKAIFKKRLGNSHLVTKRPDKSIKTTTSTTTVMPTTVFPSITPGLLNTSSSKRNKSKRKGKGKKDVNLISFSGAQPKSFIAVTSTVKVHSVFLITFLLRTRQPNGLLLYAANKKQSQYFSISLHNNSIVAHSNAGNGWTELASTQTHIADGHWHNVTVAQYKQVLHIILPDHNIFNSRRIMGSRKKIRTRAKFFIGGTPKGFFVLPNIPAKDKPFIGCLSDLSINDKMTKFKKIAPRWRSGVTWGRCFYDRRRAKEHTTPMYSYYNLTTDHYSMTTNHYNMTTDHYNLTTDNYTNTTTFDNSSWSVLNVSSTVIPSPDPDLSVSEEDCPTTPSRNNTGATRFGPKLGSRQEYDKLPYNLRIRSKFSLEFKTTKSSGLLFYTADWLRYDASLDTIAVYLHRGKIHYYFDCGTGPAMLVSRQKLNDGQWHQIIFQRSLKEGRLFIDGKMHATGFSRGGTKSMDTIAPYYVGGIPTDFELEPRVHKLYRVFSLFKEASPVFDGCLRNFKQNGKPFGYPAKEFETEECSANKEVTACFQPSGGYLVLADPFYVGLQLTASLDVKVFSSSGVLLSVGSVGDYLVLQLVRGKVVFNVDNGAGEIEASYQPPNGIDRGKWHSITVVKANNVVTLTVDGHTTYPAIGHAHIKSADTKTALHLGGIPVRHRGIKTVEQFVGCIRNLKMDGMPRSLNKAVTVGKVTSHACYQY